LAETLTNLPKNITTCHVSYMLTDDPSGISPLYTDPNRNKQVVAVIEDTLDAVALESTGLFKGTYHVLGGVISPIDGFGPEELHLEELQQRVAKDVVQEIILATNASVEGESTALYIQKFLKEASPTLRITRLARGLPAGVDLEYADQITLSRALEERQAV
jgi:recombination protein RecR